MSSAQELEWKLQAARNAVAQQRLEGLEPSPEFIRDLERAARDEITMDEVFRNIARRHQATDEVFQSRSLP